LLNVSTAFELVHLREDLVYRKPLSSTKFWMTGELFQPEGEAAIDPALRSALVPVAPAVPRLSPVAPGGASGTGSAPPGRSALPPAPQEGGRLWSPGLPPPRGPRGAR